MTRSSIVRYLNPWLARREEQRARVEALRRRDGENCRRCRRPMRFDLPGGHDKAPKLEQILPLANGGPQALDNLCLCHTRCNADSGDATAAVLERVQAREEAPPRKRRARA